MARLAVFMICILTGSFFGCSAMIQKTYRSEEGYAVFSELVHRNQSLKSFKGIGEVTLRRAGKSYFSRLAWAGLEPDKLRVELIGAPGQPKVGFSSDGTWVYYFDSTGGEPTVKQISAKSTNLERFLAVSITSSEIVSLLSGRLPDYSPHAVRMTRDSVGGGYLLSLNPRWWQPDRQEIFLEPNKKEIRKIEIYRGTDLAYRVEFSEMRSLEGYRLPSEMRISDAEGNYFRLEIDRYWANAMISQELFRLESPPDSAKNPFSKAPGAGSTR